MTRMIIRYVLCFAVFALLMITAPACGEAYIADISSSSSSEKLDFKSYDTRWSLVSGSEEILSEFNYSGQPRKTETLNYLFNDDGEKEFSSGSLTKNQYNRYGYLVEEFSQTYQLKHKPAIHSSDRYESDLSNYEIDYKQMSVTQHSDFDSRGNPGQTEVNTYEVNDQGQSYRTITYNSDFDSKDNPQSSRTYNYIIEDGRKVFDGGEEMNQSYDSLGNVAEKAVFVYQLDLRLRCKPERIEKDCFVYAGLAIQKTLKYDRSGKYPAELEIRNYDLDDSSAAEISKKILRGEYPIFSQDFMAVSGRLIENSNFNFKGRAGSVNVYNYYADDSGHRGYTHGSTSNNTYDDQGRVIETETTHFKMQLNDCLPPDDPRSYRIQYTERETLEDIIDPQCARCTRIIKTKRVRLD